MLFWILACTLNLDKTLPPLVDASLNPAVGSVPVVALITIDTWRLDHFDASHTPNLWALAQKGERYSDAWSPIGLTTPAHATMLTGLLPWVHGVEANNHHGYTLNAAIQTLPERYPDWASGAFVSAYPAGPEGGLRRGWSIFDGPVVGERSGEDTVAKALAWLPADQPALLWVHVYEPHGPYQGTGATERQRYGQEVQHADRLLRPLIAALERRGALIVVTSDHGEVLDEARCSYQHERSISPHVLRVPLFRVGPGIAPTVVERRVGLTDVPALLAGDAAVQRTTWAAESGMCEADCAPGCAPAGLEGRDRVVFGATGQWIDRPGRGRFSLGTPAPGMAAELDSIAPWQPPSTRPSDGARALGYTE